MAETLLIEQRTGMALASVMARKGASARDLGKTFGLPALPEGPGSVRIDSLSFWGTGPGAWLAIADRFDPGWPQRLEQIAGRLASISDQTGSYVLFRLSGNGARTLLQRGAAVDLDPRVFGPGSAATTVIAHIGAIIHRDEAGYDVAVFRSYAASFHHWYESVAATV
ncbi:MAG: sarcosine oxidase subunit gamma family protein [Novosphingobium sp.]